MSTPLDVVYAALAEFAATHRLVDITICGPQCPGYDTTEDSSGTLVGTWCYPVGKPAPTGKPCVWKQP